MNTCNISVIYGLLARSVAIALSLTLAFSCQRLEDGPGRSAGTAIRFGASTGYANAPTTKTEYSGLDENGSSIVSTSRYERIDWVAGSDRIRILCAAAGNGPTADYAIAGTPTASGAKSSAGITPVAENGLQWGDGDHYFYAMYPAPGMSSNYGFSDNNPVLESMARLEAAAGNMATLTGMVPAAQEAILPEGSHEFKANMNYTYMYAATKVSAGQGGEVSLAFKPLVTTFEFTFLTPSDAAITGKLTSVSLSSSSTPLSGTFVATLGEGGVEGITTRDTGGEVSVTLPGGGVELSSEYEYKVTLLTLPVEQTDLTLTLNFEGGVRRTLELKDDGAFITVGACRKVYIRNLNVPGRFETETMEIIVSSNATVGRTFCLPFSVGNTLPTKIIVDWGDGSEPEAYAAGTEITAASLTHTYADSADGDHTVTVTSEFPASYSGALIPNFNFSTVNVSSSSKPMLKGLPTSILECGSADFSRAFEGCANLESVCQDLFINNPGCTSFVSTFKGCASLTSIPSGLFDNNTNVTSFFSTFQGCSSLVGPIPEGLFDNNTKVTNFSNTFYGCSGLSSIPEGLFDNNTMANTFSSTFNGCRSLTSVPAGLFDNNTEVTSFQYTFSGTGLVFIPSKLFDNNTKVTSFFGTFERCLSLVGPIPEGLFDNNTKVTSFSAIFQFCENLIGPIPAGLFDNNPDVASFSSTFSSCYSLTGSIPAGLFDNNTKVTNFGGTFSTCRSLTGSIPAGLFDKNTKVTNFNGTFSNCIGLDGPIPAGLFANNTKVTNFNGTFMKCTGINGPIPAGLFDNNPDVTNFGSLFTGCSSLTGPIPTGLFANNTKVTNFNGTFTNCISLRGPIPADLFYNNTEATNFSLVFSECNGLDGQIPGGFFANNKKANNFSGAFRDCKNLQVVSDVFIKEGTSSPANRFFGVSSVNFGDCFRNTGIYLGSRGTAPALWTYSLPSSVTKSRCFSVDNFYLNPPAFSNQADIPGTWL